MNRPSRRFALYDTYAVNIPTDTLSAPQYEYIGDQVDQLTPREQSALLLLIAEHELRQDANVTRIYRKGCNNIDGVLRKLGQKNTNRGTTDDRGVDGISDFPAGSPGSPDPNATRVALDAASEYAGLDNKDAADEEMAGRDTNRHSCMYRTNSHTFHWVLYRYIKQRASTRGRPLK